MHGRKKITTPYPKILLKMFATDNIEKKFKGREEDKIFQNYSLFLTIRDSTNRNILRSELVNTNQFDITVESEIEIENT